MNSNVTQYGTLSSMYYDALNGYANEREISFFASFISAHQGAALEAMSGSGRLQIPLLAQGYTVDGVDASASMLDRCKQRLAASGLQANLYHQKLEALQLPHQYATVIIALASFQLIINRAIALHILKNIHRAMVADGTLLIDMFVPRRMPAQTLVRTVRIDEHVSIRATTQYVLHENLQIADAQTVYEKIMQDQVSQTEFEQIQVTWYSDAELRIMLADAGFELVKIHHEPYGLRDGTFVIQARALASF